MNTQSKMQLPIENYNTSKIPALDIINNKLYRDSSSSVMKLNHLSNPSYALSQSSHSNAENKYNNDEDEDEDARQFNHNYESASDNRSRYQYSNYNIIKNKNDEYRLVGHMNK